MTMTQTVSSRESCCLAKCRPLYMQVSTVAWFFNSPPKKLVLVPISSAMTGVHRNYLILASNAQCSEIQPLMLRGQIIPAHPPLQMDGWTD